MKNFIQIALIVLLSSLLLYQCRRTAAQKSANILNTKAALDTLEYYNNKLGQVVAEKQTYKGSVKELSGLFEYEKQKSNQFKEASAKWRKLYNAAKIELEFKIDSVDVSFNVPVPYNFKRNFSKQTPDFFLKGNVNQTGITFDFRAKAIVTPFSGVKQKGMFSSENRTEVTSSNKHLQITDFDTFTFTEKQKRWGVGLSFGLGFYHKSIFTGVTINRNFITF